MTKTSTFGRKFVRAITLNLPAQLMTDYYFRISKEPRSMTYSGGDIYLGRLPTRRHHAVRIEADAAGRLNKKTNTSKEKRSKEKLSKEDSIQIQIDNLRSKVIDINKDIEGKN